MNEIKLTGKFEEKWENYIEKEVTKIKENIGFPFFYYDLNQIEQEFDFETLKENLCTIKNEKFTISVCGAVKAGKSTFLNSILFGREVLPSFDTPMTAKITFIEYTDEEPCFEVSFYSKDEFDSVYNNLSNEEKACFDDRLEECNNKGGKSCVDNPNIKITDLDKLEEYVTDPKSGNGKYTPYVKSVIIKINDFRIKDLRIVDTPGINDPNIINSQETLNWIGKTHAVIFLLRPKGIEQTDKDFVDKFLINAPKESRLWIINKIDDYNNPNDLDKVKKYTYDLNNKEDFKNINLFSKDEKICGYSAKISLLKKKNQEELTEEEEEKLYILGDKFNPDPDNVSEIINECLYKNTGEQRITRGIGEIFRMYSLRLNNLNEEWLGKKLQIGDLKKDKNELEKQIKSLKKIQHDIREQLNSTQFEIRSSFKNIYQENLIVPLNSALDAFEKRTESKILNSVNKLDLVMVENYITKQIDTIMNLEELPRCLQACEDDITKKLRKAVDSVKQIFELNNLENEISMKYLTTLPESSQIIDLEDDLFKATTKINHFWTKKNMKKRLIELLGMALCECRDIFRGKVFEKIKTSVLGHISQCFDSYAVQLTNSIQEKQKKLELNPDEVENNLKTLNEELEELKEKFEKTNFLYEQFKYSIPRTMMPNNKRFKLGEE